MCNNVMWICVNAICLSNAHSQCLGNVIEAAEIY